MTIFYTVDEYGIREYRSFTLLVIAFAIFLTIIWFAAHGLLYFELPAGNGNVKTFGNAYWLCFMSASTIGFGDFYPVTTGGRMIVGSMFIVGGVMLGTIIGLAANMIMKFTDTNIKNRELRKQIHELTSHNEKLEAFLLQLKEHNEELYEHNVLVEKKLEILMSHVDETTPNLKMQSL